MKARHLAVLLCVGLATAAPLHAQQVRRQRTDAGKKDTAMMRRAERGLTQDAATGARARTSAVWRLQANALAAATQAEQLAHARHLDRRAIEVQAEASRNDLQSALRELDGALRTATLQQKAVIAPVLAHDQQALQHAQELVAATQKQNAQAGEITSHAGAVVEHVKQAQIAMQPDPRTGLPSGRREPLVSGGQAGGKRQ